MWLSPFSLLQNLRQEEEVLVVITFFTTIKPTPRRRSPCGYHLFHYNKTYAKQKKSLWLSPFSLQQNLRQEEEVLVVITFFTTTKPTPGRRSPCGYHLFHYNKTYAKQKKSLWLSPFSLQQNLRQEEVLVVITFVTTTKPTPRRRRSPCGYHLYRYNKTYAKKKKSLWLSPLSLQQNLRPEEEVLVVITFFTTTKPTPRRRSPCGYHLFHYTKTYAKKKKSLWLSPFSLQQNLRQEEVFVVITFLSTTNHTPRGRSPCGYHLFHYNKTYARKKKSLWLSPFSLQNKPTPSRRSPCGYHLFHYNKTYAKKKKSLCLSPFSLQQNLGKEEEEVLVVITFFTTTKPAPRRRSPCGYHLFHYTKIYAKKKNSLCLSPFSLQQNLGKEEEEVLVVITFFTTTKPTPRRRSPCGYHLFHYNKTYAKKKNSLCLSPFSLQQNLGKEEEEFLVVITFFTTTKPTPRRRSPCGYHLFHYNKTCAKKKKSLWLSPFSLHQNLRQEEEVLVVITFSIQQNLRQEEEILVVITFFITTKPTPKRRRRSPCGCHLFHYNKTYAKKRKSLWLSPFSLQQNLRQEEEVLVVITFFTTTKPTPSRRSPCGYHLFHYSKTYAKKKKSLWLSPFSLQQNLRQEEEVLVVITFFTTTKPTPRRSPCGYHLCHYNKTYAKKKKKSLWLSPLSLQQNLRQEEEVLVVITFFTTTKPKPSRRSPCGYHLFHYSKTYAKKKKSLWLSPFSLQQNLRQEEEVLVVITFFTTTKPTPSRRSPCGYHLFHYNKT